VLQKIKKEFAQIQSVTAYAQKKYGKLFVFVDEVLDEDEIAYLRKTAKEFERKRGVLQGICRQEDSPSFFAKGQLFMRLRKPKLMRFSMPPASLYKPLILPLRKKDVGVQVSAGEK
jgi:hypothetical protein